MFRHPSDERSSKTDNMVKKMDHKKLLNEVRKMNNSVSADSLQRTIQNKPLESIIEDITRKKREHKRNTKLRRREKLERTQQLHRQALLEKKIVPYPHPADWENALVILPELDRSLYRTPSTEPLGEMSRRPQLRDNVLPKGKPSWLVPDDLVKRDDPPLETCTVSFQKKLVKNLDKTVDQLRRDYASRPSSTVSLSNTKAQVGADLASMEERLVRANTAFSHTREIQLERRSRSRPGTSVSVSYFGNSRSDSRQRWRPETR
mmetsp:Transcript_9/g.8  ORF Transcript_9/g.8 Transcript_9/m.8 type:complete len:262 (+) Transcript_9:71-856(+)